MRRILFILALVLIAPALAAAGAETPKVGSDGASLVLKTDKKFRQAGASADTLYDTLGQEVQVYIYHNKTRVWPAATLRARPWSYRRPWMPRHDPRVEGLINKYAGAYGVDPALVRAVMRNESGFNPDAVSPKGAQGLMQLMPGTAALMGVRDPFDPEQNIAGGIGYLRRCLDRFGFNVPLAVAAYNAGPEAVARYCTIPPYQETQTFVNNVLGTYGGNGPNQTLGAPPPSAKPGKKGVKVMTTKEAMAQGKATEVRHRPKAKIIEVRSHKVRKAITTLAD